MRMSRAADAASGGERRSRGKRAGEGETISAPEVVFPPVALDGADLRAAAKRKERQGTKKKQLAVAKKACQSACCARLNMLDMLRPVVLKAIKADGGRRLKWRRTQGRVRPS